MKKVFYLPILLLFIFSCSSDEKIDELDESNKIDQTNQVKNFTYLNNSISFSSWEDFNNLYKEISILKLEDLELWMAQNNPNAFFFKKSDMLYDYELQEDFELLSNSMQAILNEDKEFLVEGNTIRFDSGNFYQIKADEEDKKLIGKSTKEVVGVISSQDSQRVDLGTSGIGGSFQQEFTRQSYRECSGGPLFGTTCCRMKYVHELVAIQTFVGYPEVFQELFLDVKLEWLKRNRGWQAAGEDRLITINIQGTADHSVEGLTSFNINRSISCVNTNQRILLATGRYATNVGLRGTWSVETNPFRTNTITQHVNNDIFSNRWVNTVVW